MTKTEAAPKSADRVRRLSPHALALLAGVVVTAVPFAFFGFPAGADLSYHLRFATEYEAAMQRAQVFPGWAAEPNLGYGDIYIRFYPPALYLLLTATKMLAGSWYVALEVVFVLLSSIGAWGAFLWAREVCGSSRAAVWAAFFYAAAPYRLAELYQASLLAEFCAGSILPFSFFFLGRVLRRQRLGDCAAASAACSMLLLTHLPAAIIGVLSLCFYALVTIAVRRELVRRQALAVVTVALLCATATAFYWTKLVVELPWLRASILPQEQYYDYRFNFLFSPFSLTHLNNWFANMVGLATICFYLPGAVGVIAERTTGRGKERYVATAVALFSLLMTTDVSRPLWAVIPKLNEIQFPFRWLTVVSLTGACLIAQSANHWASLTRRNGGRLRPSHLIAATGVLLAVVFAVHQVILDTEYLSASALEAKRRLSLPAVNFEKWLPVWAKGVGGMNYRRERADAPGRAVEVLEWEPTNRVIAVSDGGPVKMFVRSYYYPYWRAEAGGQPMTVKADADGAMLIAVPAGPVNVRLFFREPRWRGATTALSVLGWVMIAGLFAAGYARRAAVENRRAP